MRSFPEKTQVIIMHWMSQNWPFILPPLSSCPPPPPLFLFLSSDAIFVEDRERRSDHGNFNSVLWSHWNSEWLHWPGWTFPSSQEAKNEKMHLFVWVCVCVSMPHFQGYHFQSRHVERSLVGGGWWWGGQWHRVNEKKGKGNYPRAFQNEKVCSVIFHPCPLSLYH